jgi:hypothetical protein
MPIPVLKSTCFRLEVSGKTVENSNCLEKRKYIFLINDFLKPYLGDNFHEKVIVMISEFPTKQKSQNSSISLNQVKFVPEKNLSSKHHHPKSKTKRG